MRRGRRRWAAWIPLGAATLLLLACAAPAATPLPSTATPASRPAATAASPPTQLASAPRQTDAPTTVPSPTALLATAPPTPEPTRPATAAMTTPTVSPASRPTAAAPRLPDPYLAERAAGQPYLDLPTGVTRGGFPFVGAIDAPSLLIDYSDFL